MLIVVQYFEKSINKRKNLYVYVLVQDTTTKKGLGNKFLISGLPLRNKISSKFHLNFHEMGFGLE